MINNLKMQSKDLLNENYELIKKLFPNCVFENKLDFEKLKDELTINLDINVTEKYELNWVGKNKAKAVANSITIKTLRPVNDKFVDSQNIYIEGDNLEALKILQESYLNKIKCIYIDPPYNTGKDFIYADNFIKDKNIELKQNGSISDDDERLTTNLESNGRFHSDWLTMMYPRIKLARNLLREDGVIFISIDDNEKDNLKKLCDEIFGEASWKGTFVWRKTHTQTNIGDFARVKEYILCYAKDIKKCVFNRIPLTNIEEYRYEDENGNKFRRINLIDSTRGRYDYKIINPKGNEVSGKWMKPKEEVEKMIENGEVYWAGETPYGKNYLENMKQKGQIANDFLGIEYGTNQRSTMHLDSLMGDVRVFDFSKPLELISHFINLGSNDGDIILDFFAGASTTAHAVMKYNAENNEKRKYIMIQIPEKCDESSEAFKNGYKTICDVGKERIRRAAKKIKEETNADIDYGFRVYRVDSSNMKDVYYEPNKINQEQLSLYESNIKEDRSDEDILTQVILDLGLPLDLKIEEKMINNNKVFFVEDNSLIACFDEKIDFTIIDEICKEQPLRVVFRDISFKDDSDKINLEERFKKLSPETEINVL